ncbi:MAG: AAA family ATPase, partial [Snowella sp.]|nr:AAA family ATPase [Snowella sp.]
MKYQTKATTILTNVDQFGKFNILDYLENLEIIKETPAEIEIHCPACQAKNFKIDKKEGKYYGYSCDCMGSEAGKKEIIKAVLGPDWQEHSHHPRPNHIQKPNNQPKTTPPEISKIQSSEHGLCANLDPKANDTISLGKLASIPQDYPAPIKPRYIPKDIIATAHKTGATQNQIQEITYQYSPTQFVKRFQWPNKESSKGHSKSFRQCHINDQGKTIWKKGEGDWPLYRQTEAIESGGWILFQEGEKCVEASRSLGIASVTPQGGNWDKVNLSQSLKALQNANVPGIVFIADNDEAGVKKATSLLKASLDIDFPVIVIPITRFWSEAPEKGDLADWITWGKTNNMYDPDFIRRIEEEIHRTVNEREKLAALPPIPQLTKGQQLKLEIKAWQQETDIAEREIRKVEICCQYQISGRAFDAIAQSLELDYIQAQHNKHHIGNFMGLPTKGTPILAPGIPAIGVTILAGLPGTGKTTLAYDLAGAVLMGDEFLGEVPTQKGSVLFLACDEPYAHVQDKFINRGIANVESHLGTIITDWTVREWSALESTVDEMRPNLVIVDSFNGIHEDDRFDENSAAAANTIKKLEKLSSRYSVPIVVIHHINKSKENRGVNKLRGSSAIAASCSSILILEGTEGTYKTLSQPKIRGSEPINLTLEADFEFGRFKVVSGNLADENTKSLAQRLLSFFEHHPGTLFEMVELRNHFPSEDRKVLTNSLNRLVNRGHIIKQPSKTNLRSKVYGINCTDNHPVDDLPLPPPINPLKEFDDKTPQTIDIKEIE